MTRKEYNKRYYLEHKEELKAKAKQYREGHKSQTSINKKRYYEDNKASILEKKKDYYLKNKAEMNKKRTQWRKERTNNATSKVQVALLNGSIQRKPCEICGAEPTEAHHDDYNKPLEVRWLCREHHEQWHKNNKPKYVEECYV